MHLYKINVWKREAKTKISVVTMTKLFTAIESSVMQVNF